jgi:hypothetical protein
VPVDERHERRHVARVHLEVDVDEARDPAGRRPEAGLERGSAAAIALVEHGAQARIGGAELADDLARVVAAGIVDEDDLPAPARLLEHLDDLGDAPPEMLRLVVAGDDERDVERAHVGGPTRATRLVPAGSRTRS